MAMINCPECGKEISSSAMSCPNCGFLLKKETVVKSNLTRVGLILNIIGNVIPLCSILLIIFLLTEEKNVSDWIIPNLVNVGVIIVSIIFLVLANKRRLSIVFGSVLLLLNILLVIVIQPVTPDLCSASFYIIGLICCFIGIILIFVEGIKKKNE